MGPTWAQLGPCWRDSEAQLGAKLRQAGSKLGSHGSKIGFLRDCVVYLQGVEHRIDFWADCVSIFVNIRGPQKLENRAPVGARYKF